MFVEDTGRKHYSVEEYKKITKQAKVVDEAVKYQKERDKIIADNKELHNTVKEIKYEYQNKNNTLDLKYDNRKKNLKKNIKKNLII